MSNSDPYVRDRRMLGLKKSKRTMAGRLVEIKGLNLDPLPDLIKLHYCIYEQPTNSFLPIISVDPVVPSR